MIYEINISKIGKHFFATAERSIDGYWDLEQIYPVLRSKFPESEGYKITVSKETSYQKEIQDVEEYIKQMKGGYKS